MKELLLSFVTTLLPMVAGAYDFEIDGIYYNINTEENTVAVAKNPNKYTGNIVIPSSVVYFDVTYLVTSIAYDAFDSCDNLTSITIPHTVTSIKESAFFDCSGLNSIVVKSGNPVFDSRDNCNAIIETNSNTLLLGCNKTVIPNSVTSIGNFAFYGSVGLTSITIPNSVTAIGNQAFYKCSSLTSVIIPNSVISIGVYAFAWCSALTSVTIPNSVTSIGGGAFFSCGSLTSVTIPNSITSIGSELFCLCSSLTSITIPNSVVSIEAYAFDSCSGLTSIIIPNEVTIIGQRAFYKCSSLTSVSIGSGVEKIENEAFEDCPNLTEVYCYAEKVVKPSWGAFFKYTDIGNTMLYVPGSALKAYKNTEPWSKFKEIVGMGKQYYTLTYMVDDMMYKEYSIGEGDEIIPEPAPTKNGYTFSGWSNIPSTMPAHDVTITGTFIENTYLPGDANGDGQITVTDIGVIVDIILGKTPANARKLQKEEPQ